MKRIADGLVPDRMYYYLLDFNDTDYKNTIIRLFDKNSLSLLTKEEFKQLFNIAITQDLNLITE